MLHIVSAPYDAAAIAVLSWSWEGGRPQIQLRGVRSGSLLLMKSINVPSFQPSLRSPILIGGGIFPFATSLRNWGTDRPQNNAACLVFRIRLRIKSAGKPENGPYCNMLRTPFCRSDLLRSRKASCSRFKASAIGFDGVSYCFIIDNVWTANFAFAAF